MSTEVEVTSRSKSCTAIGYIFLAALSAWILFYNLGAHSISIRSDEVIYARVSQGIVHTGDAFNLTHGSAPFYHKPPLKFILGALAPMSMGESNFTYRFADALFGAASVSVLLLFSYRIFRRPSIGILASLLMLSCLELTVGAHGFRRAALDGLLVLLTLISASVAWRLESRSLSRKECILGGICFGTCVGAAVLTKSVGGLMPLITFTVSLLLSTERKPIAAIALILGCAALTTLCLGAVYYAPLLVASEKARSVILNGEIIQRAVKGYSGHNTGDPFFYLRYLFNKSGGIPSAFLMIALLTGFFLPAKKEVRFVAIWGIVPVVLYSFAASKTPWYVSPVVPFHALLAAYCLVSLSTFIPRAAEPKRIFLTIVAVLISVWGGFQLYAKYTFISKTVAAQNSRLPFDLFVEEVRAAPEDFHVYILGDSLSGGSSPKNGRFNVEGIYRQMLLPNLTKVKDIGEVQCEHPRCFLLVKEGIVVPSQFEMDRVLPAFGARTHTVFIYRVKR